MPGPFDPTMQTWSVLGDLAQGLGQGVLNYFDTKNTIEDRLQKRQAEAMRQKLLEAQTAQIQGTESRAAEDHTRAIKSQQLKAQQDDMKSAFANRQFGAVNAMMPEYLRRYNELAGTNRVGPRYKQTPKLAGPAGQQYAPVDEHMQPTMETNLFNPDNIRAMSEIVNGAPPATTYERTGDGIMAVTPSVVPGEDPEFRMVHKNAPKPVAGRDRFLVVGNTLFDTVSGAYKTFTDPNQLQQIQIEMLKGKIDQIGVGNGFKQAEREDAWARGLVEQMGYARKSAIESGVSPAEVNRIVEAARQDYIANVPRPVAPAGVNVFDSSRVTASGGWGTLDPMLQNAANAGMQRFPGLVVNSTGRSPEYNKEVGGVPTSQHINRGGGATAFDLQIDRAQWPAVIQFYKSQGFEVIPEPAKNHIHVELPNAPGGGGLNRDAIIQAIKQGLGSGEKPAPSRRLDQSAILNAIREGLKDPNEKR